MVELEAVEIKSYSIYSPILYLSLQTQTDISIKCFIAALHTTDIAIAYLVISEITTC